ncbi:MAG: crotonase/enoyl-CoA hydratase family protein [Aeromicrobium sp.]
MTQPRVITEIDGPVAYVWLNRPDKLNGMELEMLQGLIDAAAAIRRNRDVRVVVLQGKGGSFCAGLDFDEAGKSRKARLARFFVPNPWLGTNLFQRTGWAWRDLPVPVIAVTRGHVFGGGLQLALAADFRFTTPDCQWSILEAKWGLVPDMSGTVPLAELTTADVAKRLTMTGEIFSGQEAVEYGLASGAADDPMKPATELVEALLARSPDSVSASKKLLNRSRRGGLRGAFGRERRYQLRMFRSPNTAIARKAGMNRSEPEFRPRTFD